MDFQFFDPGKCFYEDTEFVGLRERMHLLEKKMVNLILLNSEANRRDTHLCVLIFILMHLFSFL